MKYLHIDADTESALYSVLDIALKSKGLALVGTVNQLLNAVKVDASEKPIANSAP